MRRGTIAPKDYSGWNGHEDAPDLAANPLDGLARSPDSWSSSHRLLSTCGLSGPAHGASVISRTATPESWRQGAHVIRAKEPAWTGRRQHGSPALRGPPANGSAPERDLQQRELLQHCHRREGRHPDLKRRRRTD